MLATIVSIPRSEFWSFGRRLPTLPRHLEQVSIPRSEFWSFGRGWRAAGVTAVTMFQFLGRNSGRSDAITNGTYVLYLASVSIPRSEFWSFGRT